MSSSESGSNYGGWLKFFSDAGVPQDVRATYAAAFMENRIERGMLKELSKEMLQDMGIKPIGDIILILRHIRELSNEEVLEKMTAGMGSSNANVAKVRPQASASSGDLCQTPIQPAERGGEPSGSTVRASVSRVLRKVPRTNTPQVQLQRNQRLQATSSDSVPGNNKPVVKKNPINVTKVIKSTSNTVKTTSLGSGVNVKPRQALGVNKIRSNANKSVDVQLEMSCRDEEQSMEGCIASTLSEKQKTEANPRQNTNILAMPVKRIITNSRNMGKANPKLQQASKSGTSVSVSKSVRVGGSATEISGTAGTLQSKGILKKSGSQANKKIVRSEHLTASTSDPMIKRNFVLCTDGIDSDESLPATEDHAIEKSIVVSLTNTRRNNAAQTIVKNQRIVRKPITLPVLDTDDTDSVNYEESTVIREHVSQSSTNENSPTQDAPDIHQNFRRLGGCPISIETVSAGSSGVARANFSRPAVKKNVVSLRSVKYGNELVVPPAAKVRRLPPEYEGNYTIIMPKGWVPRKQATWKDNHGGSFGNSNCYDRITGHSNEIDKEQGVDDYEGYGVEAYKEDSDEELDEELDELYDQLAEEINENKHSGAHQDVQPEVKVASVFERLGCKRGGFGRVSNSFRQFRNYKAVSVFSRLGANMPRHVHNRPYRFKNAYSIRQRAYDTLRKNWRSPLTQMSYKPVVGNTRGQGSYRLVQKEKPNVPAESDNLNVPTTPAKITITPAKKIVRFGTKEEKPFCTSPEPCSTTSEERLLKSPRKPLPGSITLRTGIFEKLGT